jgi:hypothetical protein
MLATIISYGLTYALFKRECCFEPYLIVIRDVHKRTCLSRFRMGVSMLHIETGRYEANGTCGSHGIPVNMRVCLFCSLSKVEDEIHFLLECPFKGPVVS